MKFALSLLSLLASSLVAADGLSFFSSPQKVLGDGEAVPGNNPLTYCNKDHDDDILTLEKVDLSPNPPAKGAKLSISAVGSLSEEVAPGAYIVLQVKYGLIRLVNTEADLCDKIKSVDLECPIGKGPVRITKEVDLPKEIPPGTYTVFADAYTARPESKKLLCLEATVTFS